MKVLNVTVHQRQSKNNCCDLTEKQMKSSAKYSDITQSTEQSTCRMEHSFNVNNIILCSLIV